MTDGRERIRMDLKIKIFDRRERRLHPRDKLKGMLTKLQSEDQEAYLIVGEKPVQQESKMPAGKEFERSIKLDENSDGIVFMHTTLESRKRLNDMKHSVNKELMTWLQSERMYVSQDRWKQRGQGLWGV